MTSRIQLTTDGHKAYLEAVEQSFWREIDFAQLVKIYGNEGQTKKDSCRYSQAEFAGSEKRVITGNPDIENISTSYVERQNLTMRMHMRRFTRFTMHLVRSLNITCMR